MTSFPCVDSFSPVFYGKSFRAESFCDFNQNLAGWSSLARGLDGPLDLGLDTCSPQLQPLVYHKSLNEKELKGFSMNILCNHAMPTRIY